jgi:hypothetical protein
VTIDDHDTDPEVCTECGGAGFFDEYSYTGGHYTVDCKACDGVGTRKAQEAVTLRKAERAVVRNAVRYWRANKDLAQRTPDNIQRAATKLFSAVCDYHRLVEDDAED